MVRFDWNNEKNEWLKAKRGVFQDAHPGQMIAIVRIEEYAFLVPYVREGETLFLKNHSEQKGNLEVQGEIV